MQILEEAIKKSDLENSENLLNGSMLKAVVDAEKSLSLRQVVAKWLK